MPGNRLSLRERQRIESAITDGLGYAEVARRLGRPTSTISREVNRNGGHNHYRADQAHQSAGRRAHRRAGRTCSTTPVPHTAPEQLGARAMREVHQRMVEMMCGAGFPRMMAMVLVALLLSEHGALTAAELAAHLRVSPASISKAVQSLEHLGFARREPVPRTRRQRYLLDEDMWAGIWAVRAEAIHSWGTTVNEAAALLDTTPAGARLRQMGRFLTFLHQEMLQVTQRWRRAQLTEPTPGTLTEFS